MSRPATASAHPSDSKLANTVMDVEWEWVGEKLFDVFAWKQKGVHVDELIKNHFLFKQKTIFLAFQRKSRNHTNTHTDKKHQPNEGRTRWQTPLMHINSHVQTTYSCMYKSNKWMHVHTQPIKCVSVERGRWYHCKRGPKNSSKNRELTQVLSVWGCLCVCPCVCTHTRASEQSWCNRLQQMN